MSRKCFCPKRARWLDTFTNELRDQIEKKQRMAPRDLEEFSCIMAIVLQEILADGWADGLTGGRHCSLGLLSENLGLSRKTILRHIKAAARAGLVKGITLFRMGTAKRLPLEILIHPIFAGAFYEQRPFAKMKHIVSIFAQMFVDRFDYPEDVQGFETITKWGSYDEADAIIIGPKAVSEEELPKQRNYLTEIMAAAEGKLDENAAKRAKQEESKRWSDRGKKFVEASAKIWMILQARAGRGFEAPPWAGDFLTLAGPNKRAYRDLTKIFEQYGGRKTAFAWALFCGGEATRDAKGNLEFIPEAAHRQWTTPDKRPEHFAKHISLVMAELDSLGWMRERPDMEEKLRSHYGELMDLLPRRSGLTIPETKQPVESADAEAARASSLS